ncbi:MAG: glycosyl transferase family 1 [Candidatus Marinimicrobia bacterium]|nr:glycosyl transferase family 1 [Candidatus Neomarinimicrobiota bacterium]|tara:strand:- start:11606 stop:12730 length:1125 start_codon:yes stop_codon:yes gene_type:complete
MLLSDKVILILSPESWGDNHVSKHHYALELAKRNNKVYFLNPTQVQVGDQIDVISDGLFVINYKLKIRGLNRLPLSFRKTFQNHYAKKLMKIIKHNIDILWSFEPYSFQYSSIFGSPLAIYHPVDIHKTKVEKEIGKLSHVIFGSSDRILNRFSEFDKPKLKVNHGLSDNFLNPTKLKKSFIVNPDKKNIGLIGNLHYPFLDCDTLSYIIKNNSQVDFYFIGPFGSSNLSNSLNNKEFVEFLNSVSNVYLLGSKPSKDLPSYLFELDLFLICYTGDKNIDEMANPHKMLEYLSTGKPIVSHYIDEYRQYKDLICMANDNKDLPDLFSLVINNLDDYYLSHLVYKRQNIAQNNTYSLQIDRIEKFLFNLFQNNEF